MDCRYLREHLDIFSRDKNFYTYNGDMIERLIPPAWLPIWMRRAHPLVQLYLGRPSKDGLRYAVFGSAVGLFLFFGSLSLPLLFLFLWLAILVQQAALAAGRIHEARDHQTWELLLATPIPRRDLLLATWAGNYWRLNGSWVMHVYRLLQALAVIGVMVYSLWLAEFPAQQAAVLLLAGLAAILLQPMSESYFSGMVGLACAIWSRQPVSALGAAVLGALLYWCACVGLIILLLFANTGGIGLGQAVAALLLPLWASIGLGYAAFRLALRALA